MFLVKVKAHRGGPANEEANIQADKVIFKQRCSHGMCQAIHNIYDI